VTSGFAPATPAVVRDLPLLYRLAAGGRRVLGTSGASLLRRSAIAKPLRSALSRRAPAGVAMVDVCGGRLRGTRMLVDLSCEKYYWLGTHEPRVQDWLAANVAAGSVVYDIGAHVGFFTLLCSALAGPAGSVRAFEPRLENVERLTANLRANDARNVRVVEAAVCDSEGEAAFIADDCTLEGRLGDSGDSVSVRVTTTTVDACVAGGMPLPDVLKIDVEGAEGSVIRGAAETIAKHGPTLLIEVHSAAAGVEVVDALPRAYDFVSVETGKSAGFPLAAGHYAARPAARPSGPKED
jgi:FkbM family methyltransferase